MRLADLQREIVLLGVRDHLELWAKDRWDGFLAANQMHFDQIAEEAFRGGDAASGNESQSTGQLKPR